MRAVCGESRTYGFLGGSISQCSGFFSHPICSMIYGSTGATHFDQLAKILTGYEITGSSGIFMGILSIAVGFLFKITAVPFRAAVGRPPMGGTAADRFRPILLAGKRAGLSESA